MTRLLGFAALVLAAALACATPKEDPAPKRHSSALGYRVAVPPDWTLVDREMLAVLDDPSRLGGAENIDPAVFATLRKSIESGDMEFFALPTGTPTFVDNVNVLRTPGTLPASEAAVPMTCAVTARQVSEALGLPISFRRCKFVQVGRTRAFLVDWNTPNETTRAVQYHFALTASTILSVTGTFSAETAEESGERLRKFVESLEIEASSRP